jgi:hypothetical protein
MAEKLLIGISAQGVTAAHWRGKRITDCQLFANDEGGHAAFKEYLNTFTNVPVHIMVDAVEEDYRFETLPHAFGSERAEMVGRKLKQHYRNTPYMTASRVGRERGKRRDDRYLFSALTNAELIAEWLQAVVARGLPVAGVHLLPMVSTALLEKLDVKATNLLIVAQHAGGLRLTFFRDHQFRLSRLTRGEGSKVENRVQYFSEEISNTRLYLHALRTLTLDEHLTVVMMDRSDELNEVTADIARDNPGLDCVWLGRQELSRAIGIAPSLMEVSPYTVYLHLLGLKTPTGSLAPASITVGHTRYQARRAIYAAGTAIVLVTAAWTGIDLYNAAALRGEARDAATETARLSAQYLEVTRQFPAAPASAENLKKTVEIAQKLRESVRTPELMMMLVSRALEESPTVAIKEFAWKYDVSEIEAERAGTRVASAEPAASAVAGSQGASRKQSGLIEGEIRPFRGDYRGAIEAINAFADRIARSPEVAEVRVIKLPLNVNPALSLAGNTLDSPDQTAIAEFKLLVVLKTRI